jgi:hypothetical protein
MHVNVIHIKHEQIRSQYENVCRRMKALNEHLAEVGKKERVLIEDDISQLLRQKERLEQTDHLMGRSNEDIISLRQLVCRLLHDGINNSIIHLISKRPAIKEARCYLRETLDIGEMDCTIRELMEYYHPNSSISQRLKKMLPYEEYVLKLFEMEPVYARDYKWVMAPWYVVQTDMSFYPQIYPDVYPEGHKKAGEPHGKAGLPHEKAGQPENGAVAFEYCCDAINLNPENVRAMVRRFRTFKNTLMLIDRHQEFLNNSTLAKEASL